MAKKTKPIAARVPLKLQGKSVFLAGNFYHQDGDLRKLIEFEGGVTAPDLTEKTDIVVLGFSGIANPQKKAAKLNAQGAAIQVMTREQFEQTIKPTPDEAVQLLRSGPKGIERWNRHCGGANRYYGALPRGGQAGKAAYIRGVDFAGANLANANLGEVVDSCDFSRADLSGCELYLSNCQLTGAKVDGVASLTLVACTAENVDFTRIAARDVHIEASNLKGSRFAGLEQRHLNFGSCQLDGADFSGLKASLSVQFRSCSLVNAKCVGANLEQADLAKSDLTGADFTNANLKLANLTGAKVDGADFTGAAVTGVNIAGVDFSRAKGFDPASVQGQGAPGPAVSEFVKVAAGAQRVSTTIALDNATAGLSLHLYANAGYCSDSQGYYDHTHTGGSAHAKTPTSLWSRLATKWHGTTPDLASVTVRAVKAPMANKELKQLALRAWCELFGIDAPTADDLKKVASSAKATKTEKAQEWLERLRSGKNAVKEWNDDVVMLSRMLTKVAGVNLAKAKLAGIDLRNMEWTKADLAGADLSGAQIWSCRFTEGDFRGVCFKKAQVRSTFIDANLEDADFTDASAANSSFKRANCKNVNFKNADLQRADLSGADLTGADLTGATLTQASYDEHTRWPKGFTPTLEMVWKGPGTSPAAHKLVQSTKPKSKLDIDQFMKRLEELTDSAKLAKSLSMLKADRFRLYAQVQDDHFVGVVKSQSDPDLVYSCRLNSDGTYACCTQNLNICGGLRGSLCKHLLVLIVGLTKNGELDPNALDTWIRLSKTNKPALDKEAMSETFLRYKGAEAGEVDWRPTETIPEDYYAM